MLKHILAGVFCLFPLFVNAQEISYVEISKAMLNSETLRSPVYTKALYRNFRQEDTEVYTAEKARLKELKDKKVLSTKSYNQQTASLEKAYSNAYGKENIMQQGAGISANPVGSFYKEVMNNNQRVQLQIVANKELIKQMTSLPVTKDTTVANVKPITTTAPTPEGRRGMEPVTRTRAPQGSLAAEMANTPSKQTSSPLSRKKALGEKSIPLNLSAFK